MPAALSGRFRLRGIESIVPQCVYPGFGDMHQDTSHKFVEAQVQAFIPFLAVVKVAERDLSFIQRLDLFRLDRPTLEIAREVEQHTFAVCVLFLDAYAPRFFVQALDPPLQRLFAFVRRQGKGLFLKRLLDSMLKLTPIKCLDNPYRS